MSMAFPGTKNMGEALGKMQQMMQGMQAAQRGGGRAAGGAMGAMGGGKSDAQLKAAMAMLQKMQKGGKR